MSEWGHPGWSENSNTGSNTNRNNNNNINNNSNNNNLEIVQHSQVPGTQDHRTLVVPSISNSSPIPRSTLTTAASAAASVKSGSGNLSNTLNDHEESVGAPSIVPGVPPLNTDILEGHGPLQESHNPSQIVRPIITHQYSQHQQPYPHLVYVTNMTDNHHMPYHQQAGQQQLQAHFQPYRGQIPSHQISGQAPDVYKNLQRPTYTYNSAPSDNPHNYEHLQQHAPVSIPGAQEPYRKHPQYMDGAHQEDSGPNPERWDSNSQPLSTGSSIVSSNQSNLSSMKDSPTMVKARRSSKSSMTSPSFKYNAEPSTSSSSPHSHLAGSSSEYESSDHPKSSKSVTKRSRMGCLTCRQRKKRCSESKPNCYECSRLKLKCVWPKPGTEHKNKPKEVKEEENTMEHEIYGKIKVLRGIVEYKSS